MPKIEMAEAKAILNTNVQHAFGKAPSGLNEVLLLEGVDAGGEGESARLSRD